MSDLAQHDRDSLLQIHGEHPMCIEEGCNERACDFHHCCKRGNAKDKEDRKIHSSVFGCAPLCDKSHKKGAIHRREFRQSLLRKIRDIIALSSYEPNENDKKFIEKYADLYS